MIKFEFNRDNLTFIGLVIVVLLLLMQCGRNASLNEQLDQLETQINISTNNLQAANDTVEVYKNKNGYLNAEISTYKISAEELKKVNAGLIKKYTDALSLNKKLKNVNSLLMAEVSDKDSIIASTVLNVDSTFVLEDRQDYGDGNYRNIMVKGKLNNGQVNSVIEFDQKIKLLLAVEEVKGKSSLKLATKYPFDNFDIEGIDLVNTRMNQDTKKGRWNVNFGVGIGLVPSGSTGLILVPGVGVQLGWSPKWLQF